MKILTVYFSKTGHTKAVAEIIRETVGGDLFEVKTKRTYSASYGIAVLQSGIERFRKTLPELESFPDISSYDKIFYRIPCMVVYSDTGGKESHRRCGLEK